VLPLRTLLPHRAPLPLRAIHCAGRYPPQEGGLTFNSWEGKFHLEMHWWHAAHFALWGRLPLLERSLGFYRQILPRARATAQRVLDGLSELPVSSGKYLFAESAPDSYDDPRWARDHPSVTAALGVLPGRGVDPAVMRRTLDWIREHWSWPDTWGWDYPMLAMSAARLGQQDRPIDALLRDTPKNQYRRSGHNHQREGLTVYLPGNGGLLAAVAMMAAGWDGAPHRHAPGFPADGSWKVRWEGLKRLP
jgi:protein-glucosylgalactosylhydroxylysine glucosidase